MAFVVVGVVVVVELLLLTFVGLVVFAVVLVLLGLELAEAAADLAAVVAALAAAEAPIGVCPPVGLGGVDDGDELLVLLAVDAAFAAAAPVLFVIATAAD